MTAIYLFSLAGWAGGGINTQPPNWSDESSLRAANDTFTDLAFSASQWERWGEGHQHKPSGKEGRPWAVEGSVMSVHPHGLRVVEYPAKAFGQKSLSPESSGVCKDQALTRLPSAKESRYWVLFCFIIVWTVGLGWRRRTPLHIAQNHAFFLSNKLHSTCRLFSWEMGVRFVLGIKVQIYLKDGTPSGCCFG